MPKNQAETHPVSTHQQSITMQSENKMHFYVLIYDVLENWSR